MSYWGTPNKQRGPLSGVLENGDVVPCTLQDDFIIPCPKFGTN